MFLSNYRASDGLKIAPLLLLALLPNLISSDLMACKYGERGSLTALCINATASFFKDTIYHFDHLDETLLCSNCTLPSLLSGTFDISGNRIQVLNLSNSKIEFVGEKSFTGLVFLEKLILSDNAISTFEPGAFHGSRKIKQLYLENALQRPLPNLVFMELWQLRELHLKNNSLASIEKNTFYGLNNLEMLDLSYNRLKELNESVAYLRRLKLLLLNNNDIFHISPLDFQGLPRILEINLANNLIGKMDFNFTEPNSLKKLVLSNNHLGNKVVKLGTFEHMPNLEILDLSMNWFKTIPPKLFQGLYELRQLNLANNTITQFQSGAFSGLPSLRLINVSHNSIDRSDITGTLSLHQLYVIDFSDNRISEFDFVKFLQRAPKIGQVNLRDNLLSCTKRRQIEAYLKRENIRYDIDLDSCPALSNETLTEMFQELDYEFRSVVEGSPAITAVKFLLLLLMAVLVGLLFYVHFFVLRRREY